MKKHAIRCRGCGREDLVDYDTAKAVEKGGLWHTRPEGGSCGPYRRVWGATGHIWVGQNGVDLSNPSPKGAWTV